MKSFKLFQMVSLAAILCLPACREQTKQILPWVQQAPAGSMVSVSAKAGWLLEQKGFQGALNRFPMAEQVLDLFIQKAGIIPGTETGRVTFHVMDLDTGVKDPAMAAKGFLIQLDGFKETQRLQQAITQSFPEEGQLQRGSKTCPLHVILDVNQFRFRIMREPGGSIFIGEMEALKRMQAPVASFDAQRASEWISSGAPLQGLIKPEVMISRLGQSSSDKLPADLIKHIPRGIQALLWSVSPAAQATDPYLFELSAAGSAQGIQQLGPWVQRLTAAASLTQGQVKAPELVQEKNRIGLRWHLTADQIKDVLKKLGQDINLSGLSRIPKT